MSSWGRYLRTVAPLQLGQIADRLPHELRRRARARLGPTAFDPYRPDPLARVAVDALPMPDADDTAELQAVAGLWRQGRVRIHGIERSAEDWANAEMSRLWRYERQYHRELLALALSPGSPEPRHLISSWLASCPPFQGEAWEPYPLARRTLNWSLALALRPELGPLLAPHLAAHVHLLRRSLETHLGGNHLLCDAAALVAGSSVLEAEGLHHCFMIGRDLLERELAAQVLPDGGYAERSVQYHSIVLEDCATAARLAALRGRDIGLGIPDALERMSRWLSLVRGPLGRTPWLNDAAPDATPPYRQVMWHLTPRPPTPRPEVELPDTGWSFLREGTHELLFEHGPIGPAHQPGHGHSDALSFELIWSSVPVVVDSGVTTYQEGPVRDFERSARAHAAVTVDDQGPDELWKSFRVGGRSRVSTEAPLRRTSGLRLCRGRLLAFQGWTHHRALAFWPGVALVVFDAVEDARGEIISRYPLAPEWSVFPEAEGRSRLRSPALDLELRILVGTDAGSCRGQVDPREGWVGQGFEQPVPRSSLRIRANLRGRMAAAIHAPEASVDLLAHELVITGPRGREQIALDGRGLPA